MKVTNIVGSPRRKSDSAKIALEFCNTAEQNGAKVNTYVLNNMNFKGCQGCYGCKKGKGTCVLKDDLEAVIEEIGETDILVLSTPVYAMDVPGQVKCFLDRLTSYFEPHEKNTLPLSKLPEGKKALFVQTQGADEGMFENVYEKYQQYFSMLGFSNVQAIRATGFMDPNQKIDQNILKKAEELALSFV